MDFVVCSLYVVDGWMEDGGCFLTMDLTAEQRACQYKFSLFPSNCGGNKEDKNSFS